MPIIKLRNLGSLGLNTDLAAESLNPLAFTRVENMTFRDQAPQKALGYSSGAFGTIPFVPYGVMPAQGPADYTWVVMGLNSVYAFYNGNLIDITRESSPSVKDPYNASQFTPWTGAWVNGVTFLNNGFDVPQFVSTIGASSLLADLTNWPANTTCRCLRAFKNYIIALDVTKSGVRYPTLFKWSHPADPGGIPPSWDETSAAYLAGEFPLSATPGRNIDGLSLKNTFIVYKSDGIYAIRETNDNDIFRFDVISTKFGVPAVNCVTEYQPGMHAFITQTGDLMINNGQSVRSIATNRVRKLLAEAVDSGQLDRSFCFTDVRNTEVVFAFITEGSDWPNFAVTWNWEENTFGTRAFAPISAAAAGKYNIVATAGETWDSAVGTWDDDEETWDGTTVNVISNRILSVSPVGQDSYLLGQGYTADGEPTRSFLQRRTLPLAGQDQAGAITLDPRAVKLVLRVWPIIETNVDEPFTLRIGVQDRSSGPITWQTTQTFYPKRDEWLEFFCEGRYVSYHVENLGSADWRLVGIDFEIVLNGERY